MRKAKVVNLGTVIAFRGMRDNPFVFIQQQVFENPDIVPGDFYELQLVRVPVRRKRK